MTNLFFNMIFNVAYAINVASGQAQFDASFYALESTRPTLNSSTSYVEAYESKMNDFYEGTLDDFHFMIRAFDDHIEEEPDFVLSSFVYKTYRDCINDYYQKEKAYLWLIKTIK